LVYAREFSCFTRAS
jgi:phosphoribosylanthranilate isomerase